MVKLNWFKKYKYVFFYLNKKGIFWGYCYFYYNFLKY